MFTWPLRISSRCLRFLAPESLVYAPSRQGDCSDHAAAATGNAFDTELALQECFNLLAHDGETHVAVHIGTLRNVA